MTAKTLKTGSLSDSPGMLPHPMDMTTVADFAFGGIIEAGERLDAATLPHRGTPGGAVKAKQRELRARMGLLVACALLATAAVAQKLAPSKPAPNPSKKSDRAIRVDVDLVLVNVTVTDPFNRLVTGLEQENFRVFEDNTEQEVVHFSSEDVPISIVVIFDMSGSMSNKVDKARLAALQFFKTANPQDEFFLVSFNDRAELTSRFTSSVEELQSRLMYTTARGRTALLDAIYLGLSQMRGAHNAKRALLILSDGGDNHSRYT